MITRRKPAVKAVSFFLVFAPRDSQIEHCDGYFDYWGKGTQVTVSSGKCLINSYPSDSASCGSASFLYEDPISCLTVITTSITGEKELK